MGKCIWNYVFVTLYVVNLLHELYDKTDEAQLSIAVLIGFDREHMGKGFLICEQYCVSTFNEIQEMSGCFISGE